MIEPLTTTPTSAAGPPGPRRHRLRADAMIHAALEILEPEDFVGNLWHDWASRLAAPEQAATPSRRDPGGGADLGRRPLPCARRCGRRGDRPGPPTVGLPAPPPQGAGGRVRPKEHRATFDGERLRLPPEMAAVPGRATSTAPHISGRPPLAAVMRRTAPRTTAPRRHDRAPGGQEGMTRSSREAAARPAPAAGPALRRASGRPDPPPTRLGDRGRHGGLIRPLGSRRPGPVPDRAQNLLREFDAGTLAAPRGIPALLAAVPIWPRVRRAAQPHRRPDAASLPSRRHAPGLATAPAARRGRAQGPGPGQAPRQPSSCTASRPS